MHLAKSHLILVVHTFSINLVDAVPVFIKFFNFIMKSYAWIKVSMQGLSISGCIMYVKLKLTTSCGLHICTCLLVEHNSIKCKNLLLHIPMHERLHICITYIPYARHYNPRFVYTVVKWGHLKALFKGKNFVSKIQGYCPQNLKVFTCRR
jgi:hypothetical protein